MWKSCNNWSQDQKDEYNKRAQATNKVWGEKNERERRERVANKLGFEKNKSNINNEAATSGSQSASTKYQKM